MGGQGALREKRRGGGGAGVKAGRRVFTWKALETERCTQIHGHIDANDLACERDKAHAVAKHLVCEGGRVAQHHDLRCTLRL